MDSSAWRTRLEGKWGKVRLSFPANPVLPAPEAEWAAEAFRPRSALETVSWDSISPEWEGAAHTAPWNIPVRVGDDFVPGGLAREFPFWRDVLLANHPERNTILTWVRDGVSVYDFLLPDARGVSVEQPFNPAVFPGEEMPNRVPEEFHEFVTREVATLVSRGCLVPFEEVRTSEGPARPRVIMPLSVEPSKPRLIYDARRLNATCRHVSFSLDSVGSVAALGWKGCYQGSLDDKSGFHHILLHPASWPLFGVVWEGITYVWTVLPFGWNESPFVYQTVSGVRSQFLRSRGIPAVTYIDDAWQCSPVAAREKEPREQWLAAAEGLRLAVALSACAGFFLSVAKCDLVPTLSLRYLGLICDSGRAVFRVPSDKLCRLRKLILKVLSEGEVPLSTLEKIAGKCMSMKVAIRPASLWTHYMFEALRKAQCPRNRFWQHRVRVPRRSGLREELELWYGLTENAQEGPWYLAKHFAVILTRAASDASSVAWGGVLRFASLVFQAGADFGPEWMARDIHVKEMYALHELLQVFCKEFPGRLARAQVVADVDNLTVVHNFRKGRARDATVHRLLRALFDLQMREGFWLRLRWIPSEANVEADSITRPGRDEFVRLRPHVFAELWSFFGAFDIDLMASPVSAHRIPAAAPGAGNQLPCFTRYACEGSAGVDFFSQDVSRVPGESARAVGFCFPPTALANPAMQHLAEQRAHAVVLLPSVAGLWEPRMGSARKRSLTVSAPGDESVFFVEHHQRGPQPYAFTRWNMVAVEVDFSNLPRAE